MSRTFVVSTGVSFRQTESSQQNTASIWPVSSPTGIKHTPCMPAVRTRQSWAVGWATAGISNLGEGSWGHELQTHQLLHSNTTIVKALKLWFHRGDWWNRDGTKVGLIQLHRSQYHSNTTYRLEDASGLLPVRQKHTQLHLAEDGWRPNHGDEAGMCRKAHREYSHRFV